MFDPTIFDNLKVVMEGKVYDNDLEGDIQVVDRNDLVDLATMSREYNITFQLKNQTTSYCHWQLSSTVEQLANEILETANSSKHGCSTSVMFVVHIQETDIEVKAIQDVIKNVWGSREQETSYITAVPKKKDMELRIKLKFNRSLIEEDIDDLLLMYDYMERTLRLLHQQGY